MFETLKLFDVSLNDDVAEWRQRKDLFSQGTEPILFSQVKMK